MSYFRSQNVSDGLPSNLITSFYEDSKGYIWIGTGDGLVRYDGINYESFFHIPEDSLSVGFNHIGNAIEEDEKGRIWISLYAQGFSRYDPHTNQFTSFTFANGRLPEKWVDHIQNFMFTNNGNTYINCVDGIIKINQKDEVEVVSYTRNQSELQKLGDLRVGNLIDDRWIWCTTTKGLARFDIIEKNWTYAELNSSEKKVFQGNWLIHSAFFIQDKLWFATFPQPSQNGLDFLYQYNLSSDRLDSISIAPHLKRNQPYSDLIHGIHVKQNGEVCLATEDMGLLTYSPIQKTWSQQTNMSNLNGTISNGVIRTLFEDRSQNLWIGTENGINIQPSKPLFHNYPLTSKSDGSTVLLSGIRSLTIDESDGIWVGKEGAGLLYLNNNKSLITHINGESSNQPESSNYHEPLVVHNGKLIYHVWYDGIRELNLETQEMIRIPKHEKPDSPELRSAFKTKKGEVYVWGRNRFGVLNSSNKTFDSKPISWASSTTSNFVTEITEDEKGNLWLGTTRNGLVCINPSDMSVQDGWKRDTLKFPATAVWNLAYKSGKVYFSIQGEGLWILDLKTQAVVSYAKHNGLCSNSIEGLILDEQGELWIYSSSGISWFDEKNSRFRTYTEADGMLSQQVRDATLLANGRFLLATDKGLIEFDPEVLKKPMVSGQPSLRSLRLFDTEINLHKWYNSHETITIPHDKNYLRAEFSSMEFFNPERIQFAYRMNGAEQKWNYTDHRPVAIYSNLRGGNYQLCVKQTNLHGDWGPELCIPIFVTTPVYRQAWFIVLILLFLLAISYWIYQWQLKKRLAVLEVRNRLSKDLHDDIGSTLSSINIYSSVAKQQLGEDSTETAKLLGRISSGADKMMQDMDDIVWAINPSNDQVSHFIIRMREFGAPILEAKNILLKIDADDAIQSSKLTMEKRRNLFLIFKEAVNNMAKYSEATEAKIRVQLLGNSLTMTIADNGKGFDPNADTNRHGLKNMKTRADEIGGACKIISSTEIGTEISVQVSLP